MDNFDFNGGQRGSLTPPPPPPNFIPEAPGSGAQPFGGPPGPGRSQPFGGPPGPGGAQPFGGGSGTQFWGGGPNQAGNFRRCLNRFTFVWLINGSSFWFYPVFTGWQHIEGFRWSGGRWVYDRINIRRILFFRCF